MATKSTQKLKTYRILAKVTVESWNDIKAETITQAAEIAESLKVGDFVSSNGELYEASAPEITSISTE